MTGLSFEMESPRRLLSTPKSRRRSLFGHLENKEPTPISKFAMSPKASENQNQPARTKRQLPAKFRQELNMKASEETVLTRADLTPIKKSTFYGSGKTISSAPCSLDSSPSTSSLAASFNRRLSLDRSGSSRKKPAPAPKRLSNGVSSRPKKSGKAFGINKGVQHCIRKPKPSKPKKVSPPKKPSREPEESSVAAKAKELKSSVLTAIKGTPKSGKIAMTRRTNVSYEIKNGQPVFRLRRSPRKSPYFNRTPKGEEEEEADGDCSRQRTPKQLFSPSSSSDFLPANDGHPSPPRSGRHRPIPSPVKFYGEAEKENEDGGGGCHVQNIIDNLDEEDNDDRADDDYAVYVTDDEMAKVVAEQTVRQLEEIRMEDEAMDAIHKILDNIEPPTEAEVRENRSNLQLELVDSDGENNEEEEEEAVAREARLFPLFEKQQRRQQARTAAASKSEPAPRSAPTRRRRTNNNTDAGQMIIDAGQKKIGVETCLVCGFVYNPDNAEDAKAHGVKHSHALGVIKFAGWRNEHEVGDFHDGRIIAVHPDDPKSHWDKAAAVLEVVDKQLGIDSSSSVSAGSGGIRDKARSKAYFFVNSGRIAGFALAEALKPDDRVSRAEPGSGPDEWVLRDVAKPERVAAGISRIWVAADCQRARIASRLVRAIETTFFGLKHLKRGEEYAFSHTTPLGSKFASSYTGHRRGHFLTYAPAAVVDPPLV